MKNKLLISAALGSLFALQSCKPEEITPNEVNAAGTAVIKGTIFANADESNDNVFVFPDLDAQSPTKPVRIEKLNDFTYAYQYLDFNETELIGSGDCGQNDFYRTPCVTGTFSMNPNTPPAIPTLFPTLCFQSNIIVGTAIDTIVWNGENDIEDFDIFTFMRRYGAPVAGVRVSAQYNTVDLTSTASPDFEYPFEVVSSTTDANGNYSLSIPANAKNVNVKFSVTDKTLDYTPYSQHPAGNNASINIQPRLFSATDYLIASGVDNDNGNISVTLKAGDVITQNFILTPQ